MEKCEHRVYFTLALCAPPNGYTVRQQGVGKVAAVNVYIGFYNLCDVFKHVQWALLKSLISLTNTHLYKYMVCLTNKVVWTSRWSLNRNKTFRILMYSHIRSDFILSQDQTTLSPGLIIARLRFSLLLPNKLTKTALCFPEQKKTPNQHVNQTCFKYLAIHSN